MTQRFAPLVLAELTWQDGYPRSTRYDDCYFSPPAGLSERLHVFIDGNNLPTRWRDMAASDQQQFVLVELGFGTGLTTLLAWKTFCEHAPASARLHIYSAELHPLLREDLARCLVLWPELQPYADALLTVYPIALTPGFHRFELSDRVRLTLMFGEAQLSMDALLVSGEASLEAKLNPLRVDAWCLDGFSPPKNPGMWSESLFRMMGLISHAKTTLATFSVAGQVIRGLQAAGFLVEKRPGVGRKKQVLQARWQGPASSIALPYTPWHVSRTRRLSSKRALVLGAGLAGCFTAAALTQRGWLVTVIDAGVQPAAGASGNPQALFYPYLSAFSSPLSRFMLMAYLVARQRYAQMLAQGQINGCLTGMVQLSTTPELVAWLKHYPALARSLGDDEVADLLGVSLFKPGLLMPNAGWIDAASVCRFLLQSERILSVFATPVSSLAYQAGEWQVGEHRAPIVVVATGPSAHQFTQTRGLPLEALRGQMTRIASEGALALLKKPLCAAGYILPALAGGHWCGATYQSKNAQIKPEPADDVTNLQRIAGEFGLPAAPVLEQWVGVRAATPDHLPLVGPATDDTLFYQQFSRSAQDAKQFIPVPGASIEGLYVCAGFGSRGLTTIPMCADYLAALINQEPSSLSRGMQQSIAPARFARQRLVRGHRR